MRIYIYNLSKRIMSTNNVDFIFNYTNFNYIKPIVCGTKRKKMLYRKTGYQSNQEYIYLCVKIHILCITTQLRLTKTGLSYIYMYRHNNTYMVYRSQLYCCHRYFVVSKNMEICTSI